MPDLPSLVVTSQTALEPLRCAPPAVELKNNFWQNGGKTRIEVLRLTCKGSLDEDTETALLAKLDERCVLQKLDTSKKESIILEEGPEEDDYGVIARFGNLEQKWTNPQIRKGRNFRDRIIDPDLARHRPRFKNKACLQREKEAALQLKNPNIRQSSIKFVGEAYARIGDLEGVLSCAKEVEEQPLFILECATLLAKRRFFALSVRCLESLAQVDVPWERLKDSELAQRLGAWATAWAKIGEVKETVRYGRWGFGWKIGGVLMELVSTWQALEQAAEGLETQEARNHIRLYCVLGYAHMRKYRDGVRCAAKLEGQKRDEALYACVALLVKADDLSYVGGRDDLFTRWGKAVLAKEIEVLHAVATMEAEELAVLGHPARQKAVEEKSEELRAWREELFSKFDLCESDLGKLMKMGELISEGDLAGAEYFMGTLADYQRAGFSMCARAYINHHDLRGAIRCVEKAGKFAKNVIEAIIDAGYVYDGSEWKVVMADMKSVRLQGELAACWKEAYARRWNSME